MATFDTNPAAGTRDFLPDDVARREQAFTTIRNAFRRNGFQPMDTPAFERIETLTGKYGDEGDQLIFKILKRGEKAATGEADLALRYDLTVPMARFVAKYGGQIGTPFKRYCIAPVWRADRPAKGRFREFYQCDVDTIGSDSLLADAEVLLTVTSVLGALGLDGFRVQLNARSALFGLIEAYGIDAALEETTLIALDKLDKIGVDGVASELRERDVPAASVDALVADLGVGAPGSEALDQRMRERLGQTERGRAGLAEVDRVMELVNPNLAAGEVVFAPVLARGLSYYTGPIFEIVADGIDSTIASGGRYDGLVGMFAGRDIPATGGSIGIERVLLLLAEQEAETADSVDVLVTVFDDDAAADALALATNLRSAGITTDLAVGGGKLGKQFKVADRRGARFAIVRGAREREAGVAALKDLTTGDQVEVDVDALISTIAGRLVNG